MASCSNPRPEIRPFWGACWALGLLGCQLVFGEYKAGHAAADSAGAPHTGGTAGAGGGASAGGVGSPGGAQPTGGSGSRCSGTPPYTCSGAVLQECVNGVWITLRECGRPGLCQPALGVCDVCADGERNCGPSGELSTCNADHTAFEPIDTCSSSLYCDTTADHCVACAANQAQCNGDNLAVCNADRTAFEEQPCALGCQMVDGMGDYCNDCTADSPEACASATTMYSCELGKWRASECPKGCVDATATTPALCLN